MPDLKTPLLWLLGIALLLVLAAAGVERTRRMATVAEFQTYKAQTEKQAREASEAARAEEQRRQAEQTKVVTDAKAQIRKATADAADARTAGQRLRDQLAASRSEACGNPQPASGSPTAQPAPDLLADLQRRLDEAADGIADYADQSAIAGNACQRSYEALTP